MVCDQYDRPTLKPVYLGGTLEGLTCPGSTIFVGWFMIMESVVEVLHAGLTICELYMSSAQARKHLVYM